MSFMIAAVYLRTGSVLLAMIMHWNVNSMGQLSPTLFAGVAAGDNALLAAWGTLGVMALFATLTLPALLAASRRAASLLLEPAKQPEHGGAGNPP
jgi:hypothetical protein